MKIKNVPKGLKCKINTNFLFWIRGSQKGGGSDVWEKFPNNVVFFFFESVPNQHKIKAGKYQDHNHLDFTFDATVLAAPPSPLVRTIFELKTPTNVKLALGFPRITQCNMKLKTHREEICFFD